MTACTAVNWPAALVLVTAIWAMALLGIFVALAQAAKR